MDIIVNHSSMQPIYEQIGDQIKEKNHAWCIKGRYLAPISSYFS